MDHPTLLRRPNADPIISRVEDFLSGSPADYRVLQEGDLWTVTRVLDGEVVYRGLGPVEVVRSPAPF